MTYRTSEKWNLQCSQPERLTSMPVIVALLQCKLIVQPTFGAVIAHYACIGIGV